MNKIIFPILICFSSFLWSCTGPENESRETVSVDSLTTQPSETPTDPLTGCFLRVLERDTLWLRMERTGDSLSGEMVFDNFEKDGSYGNVRGVVRDSLLEMVYFFHSEGMESVMQISFLQKGTSLVRGLGEIAVIGNSAYYVDKTHLEFAGDTLQKVDCASLSARYEAYRNR